MFTDKKEFSRAVGIIVKKNASVLVHNQNLILDDHKNIQSKQFRLKIMMHEATLQNRHIYSVSVSMQAGGAKDFQSNH